MNQKLSAIILSSLSILLVAFVMPGTECEVFKKGRFHFYSKDSPTHFVVIRADSLQTEIDTKTGDTSFWKIKWVSDCGFNLSYISGTKTKGKEEQDFYKKSSLQFSIVHFKMSLFLLETNRRFS